MTGANSVADSATPSPATNAAASPTVDVNSRMYKYSIQGRLDATTAAVYKARESAERLLTLWRSSLMRLSYLVILLTLHQAQTPITDCIKSIKSINQASEIDQVITPISLWKAFSLVWMDSICEVVSMVMGIFLTGFLAETVNFTSSRYQVATSMIPLVLSLYYQKKPLGCLQGSRWERDLVLVPIELQPTTTSLRLRGFPVVIIFHGIVTCSIWYMMRLRHQHTQNVAMVDRLQKEMEQFKTNAKQSETARRSKTNK